MGKSFYSDPKRSDLYMTRLLFYMGSNGWMLHNSPMSCIKLVKDHSYFEFSGFPRNIFQYDVYKHLCRYSTEFQMWIINDKYDVKINI